jgi:hypothetical protein
METAETMDAQRLRRFLHDVSAPLSAVALQLETATRLYDRGDDPSAALATARRELSRAFDLFEKGREELLSGVAGKGTPSR